LSLAEREGLSTTHVCEQLSVYREDGGTVCAVCGEPLAAG
jgi:hypothetical protein